MNEEKEWNLMREDRDMLLKQLEIALEFINKQSEYECYVSCGCQDDAKEALKKISETK